jgi:8-oxo-dGTP pyrophosphatase MutT (NUDIX family)
VSDKCLQQIQSILEGRTRTSLDVSSEYRSAAVLVPLFEEKDDFHLLFTRRTDKVPHHKNEISFPGGGYDKTVDDNLIQTALRELNEETGCQNVRILGLLDDILTISQYVVTPIVGYILDDIDALCSEHSSEEIQYVLKVSLNRIANPVQYWTQEFQYDEDILFSVPFFDYNGEIIWGATGRILVNFLSVLSQLDLDCRKNILDDHLWENNIGGDYSQIIKK